VATHYFAHERIFIGYSPGLEERRAGGPQSTDAIRRQIGDLDREIERATENFLRAPSEVLDLVGEKLTGLKRQRDHAREQLRAIETANGPATATDEAETTIARPGRLGNDLLNGEPARRREVYRELIDKNELRCEKKPLGKRTECPLLSGLIFLRTGEGGIFGSVSRGGRHEDSDATARFHRAIMRNSRARMPGVASRFRTEFGGAT
jgi:hypothetical protein